MSSDADRRVLEKGRPYKLEEVAVILGVHIETVRRWVRFGDLPARKLGRRWYVMGDDLLSADFDRGKRQAL